MKCSRIFSWFLAVSITGFSPLRAATFFVTTGSDTGPGSLRQAILNANSVPNDMTADQIQFAIPGSGPHTITPLTPLPAITDPVFIDGLSQAGASANNLSQGDNANLQIELTGSSNVSTGLIIQANDTTVRGLVINGFPGYALQLEAPNGGVVIEGNFIGTDSAGSKAHANGKSDDLFLGGGILVQSGSCVIGGTSTSARNVISANRSVGILVNTGTATAASVIAGNFIGTDTTGTKPLGNSAAGVYVFTSSNVTIGGTASGSGNLISGQTLGSGIALNGGANHLVQGNFIGTDATGTGSLKNKTGIALSPGESNSVIGGTSVAAANLISGNDVGIRFLSVLGNGPSSNTVQGNFIGVQSDGISRRGNTLGGVVVTGTDNKIGGTNANAGNVIAFNGSGVTVLGETSFGNPILSNLIYSNRSLGIDLAPTSALRNLVTKNDKSDDDSGPNKLQNFPVLTSAHSGGGSLVISGSFVSKPSGTFRVQYFANSFRDPTGFGEGQEFLGSDMITTGTGGHATFQTTLAVPRPEGPFITATVTNSVNNTSEFSRALRITGFQPDNVISEGVGFIGQNIYNTDAEMQTSARQTAAGQIQKFSIGIGNDGNAADSLLVKGDSGSSGYIVQYLIGQADITSQVVAGTFNIANLAPKKSVTISMKIIVPASAPTGQQSAFVVTTTSGGDSTKRDAVKAALTVQ